MTRTPHHASPRCGRCGSQRTCGAQAAPSTSLVDLGAFALAGRLRAVDADCAPGLRLDPPVAVSKSLRVYQVHGVDPPRGRRAAGPGPTPGRAAPRRAFGAVGKRMALLESRDTPSV
jgi:hypothetical protein